MIHESLRNWELSISRDELDNRLQDPNRVRYAYWVNEPDNPRMGYEAIVDSPDKVPKGITFKKVICVGHI